MRVHDLNAKFVDRPLEIRRRGVACTRRGHDREASLLQLAEHLAAVVDHANRHLVAHFAQVQSQRGDDVLGAASVEAAVHDHHVGGGGGQDGTSTQHIVLQ